MKASGRVTPVANFSSGKTPEAPLQRLAAVDGEPREGFLRLGNLTASFLRRPSGRRAATRPRPDDCARSAASAADRRAGGPDDRFGGPSRPSGAAPRSRPFPEAGSQRFGAADAAASPGAPSQDVASTGPSTARCEGVERSPDRRFAVGRHHGRARSPDRDEKRLEGERSPGRTGSPRAGNGERRTTSSITEQGPEVVETARGQRPR
jgi:hypothetical protein